MADLIDRQAAIDTLSTPRGILYPIRTIESLPSAQPNTCDGCKWDDAIGFGECHRCKRAFSDMYEEGGRDE